MTKQKKIPGPREFIPDFFSAVFGALVIIFSPVLVVVCYVLSLTETFFWIGLFSWLFYEYFLR